MSEHFQVLGTSGRARLGRLQTAHGEIDTPAFMPVGTAASVKAIDPDVLAAMGAKLIVCNTYHLYLRPGHERVRQMGGLHKFMGHRGSILTDSGGFQIFSLKGLLKMSDEGAQFRSHIDGSKHLLTPELSIQIQRALGSDIVMVLDECLPYPCSHERAAASLERTTAWAKRSREEFLREDDGTQLQFAIVQGSTFPDLRKRSLEQLLELELPGYAIGGLSVGEDPALMQEVIDWIIEDMAVDKPRYLMGVGRPWDILEAVSRGVDMFDCVLPTRFGRNGTAYTWSEGRISIKNQRFQEDPGPLDPDCECSTCQRFSRAYLSHLYRSREILSSVLLTTHNLSFYFRLMKEIQAAIREGRFDQLHQKLGPQLEEPSRASS